MNTDLQNGLIIGSVLQGKTAGFEPRGELLISQNGDYNITAYSSVSINIPGGLPQEYQAVEYIQSTGTQYIDTGITIQNGYRLNIECTPYFTSGAPAFGANDGFDISYYKNSCALYMGNAINDPIGWYYGNYEKVELLPHYENRVSIQCIGANIILINGKIITSDIPNYYSPDTTYRSLYLFAANENGTVSDKKASLKLYGCKIVDNLLDTVCNLIPCYRKSDNRAGLYDTITKTFLTNPGSDNFNVGGNI